MPIIRGKIKGMIKVGIPGAKVAISDLGAGLMSR